MSMLAYLKRKWMWLLLIIVGVTVVISLITVMPVVFLGNKIASGVLVAGEDISGLSLKAAYEMLKDKFDYFNSNVIEIKEGEILVESIYPENSGIFVDLEATLKEAYKVGRENGLKGRFRIFKRNPTLIHTVISSDITRFEEFLDSMAAKLNKQPMDAQFDFTNDFVKIIPDEKGSELDKNALQSSLFEAIIQEEGREVILKYNFIEAEITSEEIKSWGVRRLISSYSTQFDISQSNRVNNLEIGAKILDGHIIAPGEIFSFNEVVGPRSLERGFKEAYSIINSEFVPDVGGGICQLSTTLYNVALLSNLTIISRINHGLPVSYVSLGRDATVVYPTIDLKFKNTTGHYIVINAYLSGSYLMVKFFGDMLEEMTVEINTEILEEIEPEVVIEYDLNVPSGWNVVSEEGSFGYEVEVTRIIKISGEEVGQEKISVDTYKSKKRVIRTGAIDPLMISSYIG